jgi:hypothetical protein
MATSISWLEIQFITTPATNKIAINLDGNDIDDNAYNNYEDNVSAEKSVPYPGFGDIVGAALLADPANADFAPTADSPALHPGTNAFARTLDIGGIARPAGSIDRDPIQLKW